MGFLGRQDLLFSISYYFCLAFVATSSSLELKKITTAYDTYIYRLYDFLGSISVNMLF